MSTDKYKRHNIISTIITITVIAKQAGVPRPWMTSFCYGRALQDSCRSVDNDQCGLSEDHVGDGQVC